MLQSLPDPDDPDSGWVPGKDGDIDFAAIKATYDCLREQRQVDALDLNASQLSVKYSTADEYVVWAEEYMQVKE